MIFFNELLPPAGLLRTDSVLDIGAGLRPVEWFTPSRYVCVEPHKEYAEHLAAACYKVIRATAIDALSRISRGEYDSIFLLDVIEHMDKRAGEAVRDLAVAKAGKQVVVYTPLGFLKQKHDAWGMGGEYWQTHRSGWRPTDFVGWDIEHHQPGEHRAFFAVKTL